MSTNEYKKERAGVTEHTSGEAAQAVSSIPEAVTALKRGGVIVFPTDTAYGLGGDFQNQKVINRILAIKGRTDTKFTLIATSLEQVQEYFTLEPQALALAEQHWPGPLSIVVSDQFSVRVPDNDIARDIAQEFGKPLIATSANRTGGGEIYTIAEAQESLGTDAVDVWIDGGELTEKLPSTIIQVNTDGVQVIRQGPISI